MKTGAQQFIGLKCAELGLPTKQEALLFDRIGILSLKSSIESIVDNETVANIRWLLDQGFLFDINVNPQDLLETHDPVLRSCLKFSLGCIYIQLASDKTQIDSDKAIEGSRLIAEHFGMTELFDELDFTPFLKILRSSEERGLEGLSNIFRSINLGILVRAMSIYLRQQQSLDCVPLVDPTMHKPRWLPHLEGHTVAHVVLNQFPVPGDDVPWEAIIDFREDQEARSKFLRIRHWMKKLARTKMSTQELTDEIEYLVHEYSDYMRLQKMKFHTTTLETFLTTIVGFPEDIIKLRFESMIKRLFSLRYRNIALMEAERTSPGREVAYLLQARETFNNE